MARTSVHLSTRPNAGTYEHQKMREDLLNPLPLPLPHPFPFQSAEEKVACDLCQQTSRAIAVRQDVPQTIYYGARRQLQQ
ncbi:hypothetical protein ACLKA7_016986 [Drosophila subpalustris]